MVDGLPSLREREDLVYYAARFGVRFVVAADFCDHIVIVADRADLTHDGRPVDGAGHELGPFVAPVAMIHLEVLEVNLLDPRSENSNPLLRVAVEDDVAGVEVAPDVWTVDAVQEVAEFKGADQELVPDVLEGDVDAVALGVGFELVESRKEPVVGDVIRYLLGDTAS